MCLKLDLIIRYVPASDDCNILSANIGIISKKYSIYGNICFQGSTSTSTTGSFAIKITQVGK